MKLIASTLLVLHLGWMVVRVVNRCDVTTHGHADAPLSSKPIGIGEGTAAAIHPFDERRVEGLHGNLAAVRLIVELDAGDPGSCEGEGPSEARKRSCG